MQNGIRGKMTNIKKVEKNEIKQLAELAKEIWFEYWHSILTLGQIYYMVNKFQSGMAITDQMEREHYSYYFIKEDDKNIGYFGIAPQQGSLLLSKLYIAKDYRNKGYGKKTFEIIKEIAKKNNFSKIQLTVNKQNFKAILIYEKWGFKSIHAMVTRIGNGYVMDDYLMEYSL